MEAIWMNYYRLLDDVNFPQQWHLKGLVGINGGQFVRPPMVSIMRLKSWEMNREFHALCVTELATS